MLGHYRSQSFNKIFTKGQEHLWVQAPPLSLSLSLSPSPFLSLSLILGNYEMWIMQARSSWVRESENGVRCLLEERKIRRSQMDDGR